MAVIGDLIVRFKGDVTQLEQTFAHATDQTQHFAEEHKRAMRKMGAALMGFGVAAAGITVKTALSVERNLAQIRAGTGATAEQMKGLGAIFRDVAGNTAVNSEAVAQTITELNTRLGLTGDALRHLTTNLAEVGYMMGVDMKSSATALTQVMNSYNIPTNQATQLLDKLFVASQRTGVAIDKLSQQLARQGAFLRQTGFSLDQGIALLAGFEKAGIEGESMLTAFGMAARTFAQQGKDIGTAFTEAISTIKNATDATDALAYATEVFGSRGAVVLVDAVRSGRFEIGGLIEDLTQSGGAVEEFGKAIEDPAEKIQKLKNRLIMWVDSNRVAVLSIGGVVAAMGALAIASTLVRHVWVSLIAIGHGLIWTMRGVSIAIRALMGPIGWAILAIGAIGGAIAYYLIHRSKQAEKATEAMASSIKTAFTDIRTAGQDALTNLSIRYDELIAEARRSGEAEKAMSLEFEKHTKKLQEQHRIIDKLDGRYKQMVRVKGEASEATRELGQQLAQERQQLLNIRTDVESAIEAYRGMARNLTGLREGFVAIQDELDRQAEVLKEEFEKQFDEVQSTYYNWRGLFEELPQWAQVSGAELLQNLENQVVWFEKWEESIEDLAHRGIEEGLLDELRGMGPEALPYLFALQSMTDTQLAKYVGLWETKSEQAREAAEAELAETKTSLDLKLTDITETVIAPRIEAWVKEAESAGIAIPNGLRDALAKGDFEGIKNNLTKYGEVIKTNLTTEIDNAKKAADDLVIALKGIETQMALREETRKKIWKFGTGQVIEAFPEGKVSYKEPSKEEITEMVRDQYNTMLKEFGAEWKDEIKAALSAKFPEEAEEIAKWQKGGLVTKPTLGIAGEVPELITPIHLLEGMLEKALQGVAIQQPHLAGGAQVVYNVNNTFTGEWTIREEADMSKLSRKLSNNIASRLAGKGIK